MKQRKASGRSREVSQTRGRRDAGDIKRRPAAFRRTKTGIVVLGMHRSGTSALTRVLSLLGCSLPSTLMGANKSNEAGHWESTPICRLNDRILESAGSEWSDWLAVAPTWATSPVAAAFRDEAVATLAAEFGASRLFVLKDPRICRMPGFWLDALEAFDADPLVVLPVRNPLEVAASLARRNDFDPSLGQLLWLRHVLDAEHATRGRPRFVLSYDGLMTDWRGPVERMQAALGLSLPRLSDMAAMEIEAFLSDSLRHERIAPARVIDNAGLSHWLRETYAILDQWARHGEKSADFARLDRIRTAFDAAAPAFARPIAVGRQAAAERSRMARELAQVREQTKEQAHARDARIAALERDAGIAAQDLTAIRNKLAETESALTQRRHEADQLAQELAAARAELDRRDATLAARDARIAALERDAGIAAQDLLAIRNKLAETESALTQRRHEADQLAQELAAARAEFHQRQSRQADAEKLLVGMREQVALLMEEARERQAAFAELERTREARIAEQAAALSSLRDEADALRAAREAAELDHAARLDAQAQEIARLGDEAAAARAEAEQHRAQGAMQAEALRTQHAAELQALRTQLSADLQKAKAERQAAEARLKQRFDEIAVLTRMLQGKEAVADQLRQTLSAMMDMNGAVAAMPGLGALWRQAQTRRRIALLKRANLFDPDYYLRANEDVRKADMDPYEHYVLFGAKEGRAPNDGIAQARHGTRP